MTDPTRRDFLKAGAFAVSAGLARSVPSQGRTITGAGESEGPALGHVSVLELPATIRERISLDSGWKFHFGHATDPDKDFGYVGLSFFAKTGATFDASKPDFDDTAWAEVDIPHDWAVSLDFKNDPSLEDHGFKPLGRKYPETSVGWYRQTFDLSLSDRGKRIGIEFDGVFRDSIVALNGMYLGRHESGYTPFRYDITDFANFGGQNILVVRVDATLGEGWWYEGAGIYRHVWLSKTNCLHVANEGGTFVFSTIRQDSAELTIWTDLENDGGANTDFRLSATVVDPAGKTVAHDTSSRGAITAGGRGHVKQEIVVRHPALWSIEHPNLYRLITTLETNKGVVDRCETAFGIRSIRFDANQGFVLNGKPLKIKGTCNHQDFAGVGIATPDRLHEWRVERLKAMGSNAFRMSHNPPPNALLNACDRLGMLVIDETRMMSSSPDGMDQMERMIRRDRNHPSVVLWSLGNEEEHIQGNELGARILTSMKERARQLDPTRLVTVAMNKDWGSQLSTAVDVQGFNYRSAEEMDAFHRKFPDQPTIGTETAGTLSTRGIYSNNRESGYFSAYDDNTPVWGQRAESWWPIYAARPYVSGGFAWTGFDYRGEPDPYHWPCINSNFGIMDTCGFPKDNFYYYKANWTEEPTLHLFPHWNWPGKEGMEVDVRCFTNLATVELLFNERSLGKKNAQESSRLSWKVKYAPGVLKAKGYNQRGDLILTAERTTAGEPRKILLVADRYRLSADGQDISFVKVQVFDGHGLLVPTSDVLVGFDVTGPAKLIGVGNGNPSSHEADKANRRRAFNGLCLAILQSKKGHQGQAVLKAESPGLESGTASFTCQS